MKKKLLVGLSVVALSLTACGNSSERTTAANTSSEIASEASTGTEASSEAQKIDVDRGLLNMEVTIPKEFLGDEEITQESLDAQVSKGNFKSAKLNDNGSVTYVMTKAKHKELMSEIKNSLDSSLQDLVNSEDYSFSAIEPNDDYTSFTVSTSAESKDNLGLSDSLSILAFYTLGGMYNAFNGTPVDNIHVDFINEASGESIASADSKDLASSEETSSSNETASSEEISSAISEEPFLFASDNYTFQFTRSEVSKDYEGNPCVLIYYTFTNKGDEATSAMMASSLKVFQNGVECDPAFLLDSNEAINNYSKDIQKDVSLEVCQAFEITDMSDITVDVSEAFSFDDNEVSQLIKLQ